MFITSFPGEIDSDMSCLNEKLIPFNHLIRFVYITKVMGSLVLLGCCAPKEPGLEFVG